MKNITGNFTFLFTILIICVSQVLDAQDITGDWYGVWQEPDSFHITLHIYKDHRGLHALMDRPMTMTFSDPIDEITFEKDTLLFYHAGLNFHYKGCPDQDFSRIYGEMTQSGHSYTLNFGRSKIKRIMPVDEGSLQVTPVKERLIKGYNFRKTPYTGVRVVEAGIPKKIEIDTSELIVMTPGRNGISMPQVYEFPDKIKKDEYPIIYIKKRISYPNYKNKTNKAGFNTANEFIRNIRLKTAARMFLEGQTNISGVLYKVDYNSPSYFTESFRELFGMNPSDYIQQHRTAKGPENRKN